MIERILGWLRGSKDQSGNNRTAGSGNTGRHASNYTEPARNEQDEAALDDLEDSAARRESEQERNSRLAADTTSSATGYGDRRSSSAPDDASHVNEGGATGSRSRRGDGVNADTDLQDDDPSATGASDDEFAEGGYQPGTVDRDDVEEAAEPGTTPGQPTAHGGDVSYTRPLGDIDEEVTQAASSDRDATPTGGGEADGTTDTGNNTNVTGATGGTDWIGGASTSAAEDSGSLAARGIDDADDAGVSASRGTEGAVGSTSAESGLVSSTDVSSDAPEENSAASTIDEMEDAAGVGDDPDEYVSGYPSESIVDIDVGDSDDVGLYDAQSEDDFDEDHDADFSEDPGELGLTDSETVDDGIPDAMSRSSGAMTSSPEDIGVGGPDEVDDTSMITSADNATSFGDPDVGDYGPGGADEGDATAGGGRVSGTDDRSTDGAPAGAVKGDGSVNCPTDHPIKGNASSKVFHAPDMPSYQGTKAEWCFTTEADAIAAGYRAPGRRNRGQRSGGAGNGSGTGGSSSSGRHNPAPTETAAGRSATGKGDDRSARADGDQDTDESEGMQSFASTADRDALSNMQETTSEDQVAGGLGSDPSSPSDVTSSGAPPEHAEPTRASGSQGPEGLGSDPSSADDPTSRNPHQSDSPARPETRRT